MKNINRKVICILGMHRSGTSMITRVLNLCGVYIGEKNDFRKSDLGNERGYWEHKVPHDINEEILKRFNGSVTDPPRFPKNWQDQKKLDDLKNTAHKFVNNMNNKSLIWGWKDPRTCITLPFWKSVLKEKIIYVIPTRSPLSVAKSLKRRNNESIEDGLILWLKYWRNILKNTEGEERIFISYSAFLKKWKTEIDRIIYAIDSDLVTKRGKETVINGFISPQLNHISESSGIFSNTKLDSDNKLILYFLESMDEIIKLKNIHSDTSGIIESGDELKQLRLEINEYKKILYNITSAKTYKIWQFCCKLRSTIFK